MKLSFSKFNFSAAYLIVKICLLCALVLMAAMALTGEYNHHPDEVHHFEAAKYYKNHFLPPEIGDESVRDSYSVYGVSYLNYHWLEYFVAGKFIFLTAPVIGNDLLAARFFNVFLFFVLAVFFLYRARSDGNEELIFPCFLLVTPQIWYIFSYINNDAFALAASLVTASQIANPKSAANEFLQAESFSTRISGGLVFGALLGVLLILKTNYYAFLIFAALWLLYRFPIMNLSGSAPKLNFNRLKKYALLAVVALSILTFRCALDFYVNGETNFVGLSYVNYFLGNFEDNRSRLLNYQEEVAAAPYKPSTVENDLSKTDSALKLKAKGTSFKDIFRHWRWHESSFKSFVGVYGYMNILAPRVYYQLMTLLYVAFGCWFFVSLIRRKQREDIIQALIFLFGFSLTIFISAYLSWSYAFQAQGRYLFPIIAMACLLVYSNRRHLNNSIFYAFVGGAFLASAYSFIFVALARINH
jgi:hypothetical protein